MDGKIIFVKEDDGSWRCWTAGEQGEDEPRRWKPDGRRRWEFIDSEKYTHVFQGEEIPGVCERRGNGTMVLAEGCFFRERGTLAGVWI